MNKIDIGDILSTSGYYVWQVKNSDEKRRKLTESREKENGIHVEQPGGSSVDEILAAIENTGDAVIVDEHSIRQLVTQLEKRNLKNREMRIKYSDEPQKFMDAEMELNVAIQEMHILATQPDLYGLLVDFGAVITIIQLIAHENNDISGAVIHLLQELTDLETLGESEKGAASLVDSLINEQLFGVLVQSMEKMDESNVDESDAVHNSLAIIENVLDFRPDTASMCVDQGLFTWLLKRISHKSIFDGNKLYASELLGMILQADEKTRKKLTDKIDGIDILLRTLAGYKRHDPDSHEEWEFMENLFDSLCAALMHAPNRLKFLEGEGLQLMNLMLRERKQSRESALKVLNHATSGIDGKANCDKFIDILGLRTLFPLFMRTPDKAKRKDTSSDEHEEHVCAVICSLLKSANDANRTRLLSKFLEQDHAKIDRLVELYLKYTKRISKWTEKCKNRPESDPDQQYVDKLDAGLFTLQLVAQILADVCVSSPNSSCRDRAGKLMQIKGANFQQLIDVLVEYQRNLGPEANEDRDRLKLIVSKMQQF